MPGHSTRINAASNIPPPIPLVVEPFPQVLALACPDGNYDAFTHNPLGRILKLGFTYAF